MSETKYTPGKWINKNGNISGEWEGGKTIGIAIVGVTRFCGDDSGSPNDLRMRREDEANARLIASAPELLELVCEINFWLANPDLSPGVIGAYKHDCELAIAQATGKAEK